MNPRRMVNLDMMIAHIRYDYGGAYEAVRYAEKKGLRIIHVG